MKKILLSSIIALSAIAVANSQVVYKDGFTGGGTQTTSPYFGVATSGYSTSRTSGGTTCTITKTASATQYESTSYSLYTNPEYQQTPPVPPVKVTVDMSGGTAGSKDSIFVVAKSSTSGHILRVDIKDNSSPNNFVSDYNVQNTATLTTSYTILKFAYAVPQDAYSTAGCSTGSPCTVNKATIKELLLSIDNGVTPVTASDAIIDYIQLGGTSSAIVVNASGGSAAPGYVVTGTTAVSEAQANIASSKVYPNPTSDIANIALELKSASDVKVTLSDLMGKEVMTIANGTMSSLNESFSVANLHKGIYTVNYFINGSAAKAELLMVK